ncbi:amino acid adenylation domain-containing protein [Lysinibacillus xylanilyticus]|uniref:amino acid adenylation domain-containing protein n=1 Tax=Lysinibacillus xylanilyticus TaxID=582475 RepID=UPI0038224F72
MKHELTHPQKRIWYTQKLEPQSPLHNIGGYMKIEGIINVDVLKKAILDTVNKNEAFQLKFDEDTMGNPFQYVCNDEPNEIVYIDFSNSEDNVTLFTSWVRKEFDLPFLIENNFLYKFYIYKMDNKEYGVLFKVHHLISDGWSISLLQKQICYLYSLLVNGISQQTISSPSYLNYIEQEKEYIKGKRFTRSKEYWADKLKNWPDEFQYSGINSGKSKRSQLCIDKTLTKKIRTYINNNNISMNVLFLTVMYIYHNKKINTEDVVLGVPVFNRSTNLEKNTIGMFTSTMPFRVNFNCALPVRELIEVIKKEVKKDFKYQKYPYDLLVTDLKLNKLGFDSFFTTSINYYNSDYANTIDDIPVSVTECTGEAQNNSIQLVINEWEKDNLTLFLDYKENEYTSRDIDSMFSQIKVILKQVIDNDKNVNDITLITKEEFQKKILSSQKIIYDVIRNNTVIDLFEKQVSISPQKTALISGKRKISYKELDETTNQWASYLKEQGVKKGKVIGVQLNHSTELIFSILAILKVGGVYLPIDPKYPNDRIQYMLEDAHASFLISDNNQNIQKINSVKILDLKNTIFTESNNVIKENKSTLPEDLAYIIYTSGSTGNPKGVMIEHRNLTNYITWANSQYLEDGDTFALHSSIAFDLTITSLFTPLTTGNTIKVFDPNKDFVIEDILDDKETTVIKLTPSHLHLIKNRDNSKSNVKKIIIGGENLSIELTQKVLNSFNGQVILYNEYGPTEATVGCMIYTYTNETTLNNDYNAVPIGIAINNTDIYILDEYLKPVPDGMHGEIYISGDGVARGYINKEVETEKAFIKNPFINGERMYKTGDIGKYHSNGEIEYIGRIDGQVKIRGFRIEPLEIERHLLEHPAIETAVVLPKKQGDRYELNAYFVLNADVRDGDINRWLRDRLPSYMIPSKFSVVKTIPLTINGKIDSRALLEMKTEQKHSELEHKEEPKSLKEKLVLQAIREVIGDPTICLHDNFLQVGGDSIIAIQVASKLKNNNIKVDIKDFLDKNSIMEIVDSSVLKMMSNTVSQVKQTGNIENTPIMEWFFEQKLKDPNRYTQQILLKSHNLKKSDIDIAFETLITHHDILRMKYDKENDNLFYNNSFEDYSKCDFFDLTLLNDIELSFEVKRINEQIISRFDMTSTQLFRICIIQLNEEDQLLLFIAHHLIIDAISWRIIIEDFKYIIEQLNDNQEIVLPLKTHSLNEWVRRAILYSGNIDKSEIEYWKNIDEKDCLIPFDFDLGDDSVAESCSESILIDSQVTESLFKKLYDVFGLDLNEGLIIGLLLTINQLWYEKEITIELEGHGRNPFDSELDVSRTIGWFTSLYPANFIVNYDDFEVNIKDLKEQLKSIPKNGFDYSVLKYLKKEFNNHKKKAISFNYLGSFDNILDSSFFKLASTKFELERGTVNKLNNVIEINAWIVNKELQINLTYSKNKFSNDTIKKLMEILSVKLHEMLILCNNVQNKVYTPSDFDAVNISQADLDSLFE